MMLLSVLFWIPDTIKPNPEYSLLPAPILKGFLAVLKEPHFYTYAFAGAFSIAGLLAYVAGSPQVFMEIFHVNGKVYGWIFAVLSVGLIGSSQVNSQLLKKYTSVQILHKAMLALSFTGTLLFIGSYLNILGLAGTLILIFIFLCCTGFILPNTSALTMAPFSKNAGSASALMGASQMGIGALASIAMSTFNNHTPIPMAIVMMITAIIALLIFHMGSKKIAVLELTHISVR
jgi:DHA1 family bicyclomycin/chloramphenicol resistance-like MFS transporter